MCFGYEDIQTAHLDDLNEPFVCLRGTIDVGWNNKRTGMHWIVGAIIH